MKTNVAEQCIFPYTSYHTSDQHPHPFESDELNMACVLRVGLVSESACSRAVALLSTDLFSLPKKCMIL